MLKVTSPGFCAVEVAGDPLGKTHEYLAAVEVVPKETDPPATTIVSEAGVERIPFGGGAANGES